MDFLIYTPTHAYKPRGIAGSALLGLSQKSRLVAEQSRVLSLSIYELVEKLENSHPVILRQACPEPAEGLMVTYLRLLG